MHVSPGTATNTAGGGGNSTITSLVGITTLGQKTMANSLPVVLASDQGSFPVTISGVATANNQTGGSQKTQIVDSSGHVIASQTPDSGTTFYLGIDLSSINGGTTASILNPSDTLGPSSTNYSLSVINFPHIYTGASTTYARTRQITNAINSVGTGITAAGILAQFDDVSPTAITENQFGNIRMSTNRNLYGTIRDAAGNERGANVTASSELLVNVNNATLAVTQSGTWNVATVTTVTTVTTVSAARIVGNGGAVLDGVNTAATAPANGILGLGIYNSTEPSPTTGQSVGIQLDSKGRQRQVIMDAAGNTRGANVDANNNLGVVLAAETTKVLGVVRTADGTGNLLTTNSTTYTAKFGLDSNLLGTLGTAFSTAGKVDVKGADGDVFVRQTTGSNLHVAIDSGTVTTVSTVSNLSQIASVTPTFGDVNNSTTETGSLDVALIGRYNATLPTITDTRYNQLQIGARGALHVNLMNTDGTATLFLASAALADTASATPTTTTIGSVPLLMNASTLDRARAVINTLDSTGIGIAAVGIVGQFDDTSPTAATENKFDPIRISSRREMYIQIRDAGGNERGVNVDANGGIPITIEAAQTLATVTTVATVTNLAQMNGAALLMGNGGTGTGAQRVTMANDNTAIANWGQGATGSAVPSGAQYNGVNAQTALPTAATAGNLTGITSDKFGRVVVLPQGFRDLITPMTQLTLSNTNETTLIGQTASVFNDILSLTMINTSATGTQVDLRDSTGGTVRWTGYVPPTDMRGIVFQVPLGQATVNNNWTAKLGTSVSSVIITGQYIANK